MVPGVLLTAAAAAVTRRNGTDQTNVDPCKNQKNKTKASCARATQYSSSCSNTDTAVCVYHGDSPCSFEPRYSETDLKQHRPLSQRGCKTKNTGGAGTGRHGPHGQICTCVQQQCFQPPGGPPEDNIYHSSRKRALHRSFGKAWFISYLFRIMDNTTFLCNHGTSLRQKTKKETKKTRILLLSRQIALQLRVPLLFVSPILCKSRAIGERGRLFFGSWDEERHCVHGGYN